LSGTVEATTDGDVMGININCLGVRYAIVQVSCNKDRPERVAIAYDNERCLLDLIAAPSILKLGFASREEAMANLKSLALDAARSKQNSSNHEAHENGECADITAQLSIARLVHRILQSAVVILIALFHSKHFVWVMIRMALGASF
jgi:hypothetical protein